MSKEIPQITTDTLQSHIGEGVHTGLRKGTDAPEAPALWDAINQSDRAWSDALAYCMWGLRFMYPNGFILRDLDERANGATESPSPQG